MKKANHPLIIIPFRLQTETNRYQQLNILLDRFDEMFNPHNYTVIVVEQTIDQRRKFNRGKLLNIGFDIVHNTFGKQHMNTFSSIVLHDVDLLPSVDMKYEYHNVQRGECNHLASVWDRYNNDPKYFGGVVAMTIYDFYLANGFPNTFWGWGGEDQEFRKRIIINNIYIKKNKIGHYTDLEKLNLQEKLNTLRTNGLKCHNKWELLNLQKKIRWKDGLYMLNYSIKNRKILSKNQHIFTVKLFGDMRL